MNKIGVLILIMSISTGHASPYSNLMVFGDSLTDIGNFPEAKTIEDPYWGGIAQHYYIPATNPVGETSPQNWLQVFHQALFKSNPHNSLIPQIQLGYNQAAYDLSYSIDYAWWAALVTPGCYNDQYQLVDASCHFSDVFLQQDKVRNPVDEHQMNYQEILIPGLPTQVDFFLEDLHSHRIEVDSDTLYVMIIGGNELYHSQELFNQNPLTNLSQALDLALGGGVKYIERSILNIHEEVPTATHFLVLNLYNLKYTPHVINDTLKSRLADLYTQRFNKGLQQMASDLYARKGLSVALFDLHLFFDKLANSSYFKSSLGLQCDEKDPNSIYYQRALIHGQCELGPEHGYLFWNNSHPSAMVHLQLGKALANSYG